MGKSKKSLPDNVIFVDLNTGKTEMGEIKISNEIIEDFARAVARYFKVHPELKSEDKDEKSKSSKPSEN